ncbi:hypothetical protein [Empedobacter brevis]|uniref:hypothetical protein n=1 Tax=Empedobacter brevis TaxID=247 RepID=UPI0039AEE95F
MSAPVLIGFVIYRLIKEYSQQKYARCFAVIYSIILLAYILSEVFSDELFSKNDAVELVEDLDFKLNDDFRLTKNVSYWGIGDYYHTFTLEISNQDKNRLIQEIKTSSNFITYSNYSTTKRIYPDRYKGKKLFGIMKISILTSENIINRMEKVIHQPIVLFQLIKNRTNYVLTI